MIKNKFYFIKTPRFWKMMLIHCLCIVFFELHINVFSTYSNAITILLSYGICEFLFFAIYFLIVSIVQIIFELIGMKKE